MKATILLQSDLSLASSYVASMKGVIKTVDEKLNIHDLTHDIKKFSPWDASLSLERTVPYWPSPSYFVSIVDPSVGTERRAAVALLNNKSYVITPDNGTLTHLNHSIGIMEIRKIDDKYRFPALERTEVFHGRDIFAYTAALLASGKIKFKEIGERYSPSEIVECEEYSVKNVISATEIRTWIMETSDHFGTAVFCIKNSEFKSLGFAEGEKARVRICEKDEIRFLDNVLYAKTFSSVGKGQPILYPGSALYISLDLNMDNFIKKYNISSGPDWNVIIERKN